MCDFCACRMRIGSEQRLCGHDDAWQAVTALRGIGFDQGLSHRCVQASRGFYMAVLYCAGWQGAAIDWRAIHQDPAGTALLQAAAEFGCHVADRRAAEGIDQWCVTFLFADLHVMSVELEGGHGASALAAETALAIKRQIPFSLLSFLEEVVQEVAS